MTYQFSKIVSIPFDAAVVEEVRDMLRKAVEAIPAIAP
jgi:hypothetical protein